VKKNLLWLACALFALALAAPAFGDTNPLNPPGKTTVLQTVLADTNPLDPPGKK
jgi:hypothetical protein